MKRKFFYSAVAAILLSCNVYGQDVLLDNASEMNIIYSREMTGALNANTSGIGGIFRQSKAVNYFKSNVYEIGFSSYRDPKEEWYPAIYQGYRRYKFGKLNSVFFLYGGFGSDYNITKKPYWGGVEIQLNYSLGIVFALAKPIYLYVVAVDSTGIEGEVYYEALEKYDPDKYSDVNILGRGPFYKGLNEIIPYPGVYGKIGFTFDYGEYSNVVKSLGIGLNLNYMPIGVPVMAYNDPRNLFCTLYVSLIFGKRYNK